MASYGSGFAQGMDSGQRMVERLAKIYQDGKQRSDLAEVANATATESTGFTADQGQKLEGAISQGFDNVTFDDKTSAYVAKNAEGETKSFAMQGVTDLMGSRTAGGADSARGQAYADVMAKHDPAKGMQLRRELGRDAREDERYGRERKQWAKEDSIEAIDTELGAQLKGSMVDAEGKPVAPTPDLYLGNMQQRAARLAQAGHAKQAQEAMTQFYGMADVKIRLDSKQREQDAVPAMAAFQAGDMQALTDYYNKYVPGSTKISGIERGKDGGYAINFAGKDGQAMPSRTLDERGMLAMAQSLNDPNALLKHSWDEANYALKLRGEKRADNADVRADRADGRAAAADGRAAASHAGTMADRRELRDVREALARETDPSMTPTQLRAVRAGVLQTPGADKGGKYDYDPVKVQKTFGETSADPFTGKETVKRNAAEERKFMDFMADNPSIRDVDEGLVRFNRSKVQGERKAQAETSQRREKTSAQMTDANLAATAKKYNMTVAQVVEELAKQGVRR